MIEIYRSHAANEKARRNVEAKRQSGIIAIAAAGVAQYKSASPHPRVTARPPPAAARSKGEIPELACRHFVRPARMIIAFTIVFLFACIGPAIAAAW